MKKMIRALSALLILFVVVSCSKDKDAKPTSDVLFYVASTANIGSYIEVELNGTVVGRLTSKFAANTEPNCNDSPSSRLIKVSKVEVGVEHKAVFRRSDGVVNETFFTIDPSIKSGQCWSVWLR